MNRSIFVERMFRSLVAISERDPALFQIEERDGEVHVHGPCSCRVYPSLQWISRFSRDLYSGHFEKVETDRG